MNTKISSALATIVGAAFLGATASASATSDMQVAPERVLAYGSYYVFGRAAIDDLDALETAVRAANPKGIQLTACGATAAQALKAAAHRFRDQALQIQVLDVSAPTCSVAVARRASQRDALIPRGIDEPAVDAYWVQVTP